MGQKMKCATVISAVLKIAVLGLLASCTVAERPQADAAQPSVVASVAKSEKAEAVGEKTGGEATSNLPPASPSLPYRPKNGDKLGYSKEESARRLSPQERAFLDAILRLYQEPGLFAHRREVFALLGTEPGRRENLSHSIPRTSATDPFREYAAPKGLFAREGWKAIYTYRGREDGGEIWRARLDITIPQSDCIDSRSVEGYLDLYLITGLDGISHPPLPEHWDRHGVAGSPFARAISSATPGIDLGFVGGCAVRITLSSGYKLKEVSDDNVLN
ncbi:hypothetical protein EJP67_33255 [Variovorax guangxiensis]|uniref:Uncharacterized protein n=1 Tax=Variovorax guangxiensis TaxID=1775474 RepID=A0A433MVV5_9BURK|nr:hypothetical protein [Variovorax guangxiensis]RUR71926.1 hypothetical protein EJP67_33255 [Variovorax guangxiensis]